ncbi:MAG: GC-type dockerin domain-anchored protein [Phycisphaerales bacterium]|jgi:DNA-binding beta-propeller fold protein YncE
MHRSARSSVLLAVPALALVAGAASAQDTLYAVSNPTSPQLWTVDTATGFDDLIGAVTGAEAIFSGMALDDAGALLCVDGFNDALSDRLLSIDPASGAGMVIGDTGENWNFRSVAFDAGTGTVYAARDNRLYTADRSTGAVTFVANITGAGLDQLTSLVVDADGNAYGSDIGDCTVFEIDLATGAATPLGEAFPGTRNWFNDLAIGPDGTLWGAREQGGGLFTIDRTTGEATLVYPSRTYRSIAFERTSAPCYADFDGDGELTIFDFLAFQNAFDAGEAIADCDGDGSLTLFDFLCFQNAFDAGCE